MRLSIPDRHNWLLAVGRRRFDISELAEWLNTPWQIVCQLRRFSRFGYLMHGCHIPASGSDNSWKRSFTVLYSAPPPSLFFYACVCSCSLKLTITNALCGCIILKLFLHKRSSGPSITTVLTRPLHPSSFCDENNVLFIILLLSQVPHEKCSPETIAGTYIPFGKTNYLYFLFLLHRSVKRLNILVIIQIIMFSINIC